MKLLKIKNIKNISGKVDYKGLDIKKFIPGTQIYMPDLSYCLVGSTDEDIVENEDIVELTEVEYEQEKNLISNLINEIPKPKTLEDANAEIKTLQDAVDQLILDSLSL